MSDVKENDKKSSFYQRKSLNFKHLSRSRQSPYILRSIRTREIGFSCTGDNANERNKLLASADLKSLTFTSWKTYRVTTLLNFKYNKVKFKEYAQYLSSLIEKEKKKNLGVLIEKEKDYKVNFSVLPGFNTSQADSRAIKIEILSGNGTDKSMLHFTGVLASVERIAEPWETASDKKRFTFLPLLLAKGTQVFLKVVANFLESHFSCLVQPLIFSHINLSWMLAMWAGSKREDGLKPLVLEYSIPCEDLSTIKYYIDGKSVYEIWSRIHDPTSNEMDEDEVYAFVNCLEKHFLSVFSINLSSGHLCSVGTNAIAVHRNGVIKIFSDNAVRHVLRHLTSLAQELIIS